MLSFLSGGTWDHPLGDKGEGSMGSPPDSKACLAWGKVDALPMVDMLIDMDHGGTHGELLIAVLSFDLSINK